MSQINIEALIEDYTSKLDSLQQLEVLIDAGKFNPKDEGFARSLFEQFLREQSLSPRQWPWINKLVERVTEAEPIYGSFAPVRVMLRLAYDQMVARSKGAAGPTPRVRLMTNWKDPNAVPGTEKGQQRFVELRFNGPDANRDANTVTVYVDGWSGHGYRKFAGWVEDDKLVPYDSSRMTHDVKDVIQDFSMDPAQTSRAMAGLLSACCFCGTRLSDDDSKALGYGPTCAGNYNLPHSHEAAMDVKTAGTGGVSFLKATAC